MSETTENLFTERKRLIAALLLDTPMLDHERLLMAMNLYQMLADGHSMARIISRITPAGGGDVSPAARDGIVSPTYLL